MKETKTTPAAEFRTPYQKEKAERDLAIFREFQTAIENDPKASREAITAYCMKKYKIHSRASVWAARRRGEQIAASGGQA